MTTLFELAKKLHNTLALYNGAGHALGWKTEKVDKLLDESKRVIENAKNPEPSCPECSVGLCHCGLRKAEQPAQQEPVAAIQEVIGCFDAALAEGLQEALAETTDERLKDLVERRLMYALYAAQEASPQPQPPAQRTWVGLTDDEIENLMPDDDTPMSLGEAFVKFARALEDRLEGKNRAVF